MTLRLPKTFAAIFGTFTLGFYVAIQGPTLMDLIDLLHVNNDIMSYSLAFASLAYSVGGLLSGFLFNYVNRQILIAAYYLIFGISNIVTPFISNYFIFSVITVFKMMCAGGTDCAGNVWILEMWPGKDSWLQALHFSFALGCALGPLVVEPFLSVEYKENELDKIAGKNSGSTVINEQNESRIHIPYAVSGLSSVIAAIAILYLYVIEARRAKVRRASIVASAISLQQNRQQRNSIVQALASNNQQQQQQQHRLSITAPNQVITPEALEAGLASAGDCCQHGADQADLSRQVELEQLQVAGKQVDKNLLSESAVFLPSASSKYEEDQQATNQQQQQQQHLALATIPETSNQLAVNTTQRQQQPNNNSSPPINNSNSVQNVKITSKAREQLVGRPPYYVMFAIALAALCLSFYCGIEITSMNYLATFAVNIELQLPKSTAALMSSALTISFAVGRLFGIWLAAYMKPHKLFYLCIGVMATGNVLMLIFANTAEMLLWYSICLFGIGCGPMFPAIVSFYDDKISKVTNTVSGIFILGSMFNVALNSLIIGHHIIDNALILIVCNLVGSVLLLFLFGTLHMLTKVKKSQRVKKFKLRQQLVASSAANNNNNNNALESSKQQQEQLALLPPPQAMAANQINEISANSNNNSATSTPQQQQTTTASHNHNKANNNDDENDNNNQDQNQQRQPLLAPAPESQSPLEASKQQTTTITTSAKAAAADMVTVTTPTPTTPPNAIKSEGAGDSKQHDETTNTTKPID